MNRPSPRLGSMSLSRVVHLVGFALVVAALSAPAFAAKVADMKRHPGFVDGSAFVDLAGEDSSLVEINIGPSLLEAIARGAADDPEVRSVLSGLVGVNAYIVGLDHDAAREGRATKMVKDIAAFLETGGWERLVRVREKDESVNVYIRSADKTIEGLVVLVLDRDESEVVFANLVGTIDLAGLGALRGTLDVPGLDAIGDPEKQVAPGKGPTPPEKRKGAGKEDGSRPGETPRGDASEEES